MTHVTSVFIAIVIAIGVFTSNAVADEAHDSQLVDAQTAFRLSTVDGREVNVDKDAETLGTVVCFLGTECPLVKLYSPRLSAMAAEFAARKIRFVGINSNRQDTREDIERYQTECRLSFPLLRDPDNTVADRYGAVRTPEVFLLDQNLKIVYHGRIDDQYAPGINRPTVGRHDLKNAIEELIAGVPVSVATTDAVGCMIGKVKRISPTASTENATASITYCNQVSRVLQKHCVECHRAGEIGPFSLERFEDVVGWADTCLEVIDNGRMPPWHADSSHGAFANARQMPETDKQIFRDWMAAGLPKGNDMELPPAVDFAGGWQTSQKLDLEIPMRDKPYTIPAEGTVEYQYFVVDPGFTEEKWVTAAQVIPGNRSVVHHAIVFIRPPDGQPFRGVGWLTAYVPGQRTIPMPPGHARRIPAGSKLVFQMHYTTNGSEQLDLSKVGIAFTEPQNVTDEVITLIGIDQEFEIPPHDANHEVSGSVRWFPPNGKVLAIAPHMHVRGKSFELTSAKDGASETLLKVPQYDFNWQHSYVLAEPLSLANVDKLNFTATFDNSSGNPFNPDPSEWVNWGDQTWEEMAVVFLEVSEPLSDKKPIASGSQGVRTDMAHDVVDNERAQRIQAFVDDFFRRLDTNGDGVVLRSEAPIAVRSKFGRFDLNGDQAADAAEIREVAGRRF